MDLENLAFFLLITASYFSAHPGVIKMGSEDASKVTMESIRQRMVEVERIHRKGKKVAITDTLVKDIGWLFRRIGFLTKQVRRLGFELEAALKEKKELSDDNVMADKVKMLMERVQSAEEEMRAAQKERQPLKRENNSLRQEMKLLEARTKKAEMRARELSNKLKKIKKDSDSKNGKSIDSILNSIPPT